MKFKFSALALVAASFVAAAPAYALSSFDSILKPGTNTISDDNAEVILKWTGTGYRAFVVGTDTVAIGDIMVGIVGMTSFPTAGVAASTVNEITAMYAVQVTASSVLPAVSCGAATLTTCTNFSFGAVSAANGGLNGAITKLNSVYGTTVSAFANTNANSIAAVFEDTTPDFSRAAPATPTYASAFATATDGTERMVLDLSGGSDYFFANAPANVAQLAAVTLGANAGSIGGQMTIGYQNVPGWALGPTMTFTGNISQATTGPFSIWTDSTYTFNATPNRTPEPASLAITGLALAALGLSRRNRRGKPA